MINIDEYEADWLHDARASAEAYDPGVRIVRAEQFHLQGQHDQKSHGNWARSASGFEPITAAEARGNSPAVSAAEFQRLARIGQERIAEFASNSSPTVGLDEHWESIRERAWTEAQKPWGGATIDSHTGEFLPDGADKYALTVKGDGVGTVVVSESATADEFYAAMDEARAKFRPVLERQNHYLGVFHDDDLNRVDIDPVTVVDTLDDVHTIGAATRAIGGAYNFADGNGYWPPHVAEEALVAVSGTMGAVITQFKGPAEWKRQAKQLEGAPDAAPAVRRRTFTDPDDGDPSDRQSGEQTGR